MPTISWTTFRATTVGFLFCATLLVTAPAPARADDQQAARIIAGIVALGIIAKALDDDDEPHVVHRHHYHQPRYNQRLYAPDVYVNPRPRRVHRHHNQPQTWQQPRQRHVHRPNNHVQQWPRQRAYRKHVDPWPIPTPQYLRGQTNHPSVASPNH